MGMRRGVTGGVGRAGFTLIEILVVIVIIGVLATIGVSKYTEFTTDSRKNTCIANLTEVDKGVGVWESQRTALSKASRITITFSGAGDITAISGVVPATLNTNAPTTPAQDNNRRSVAAFMKDGNVFMCAQYASNNGGMGSVPRNTPTFLWISDPVAQPGLNNNRRGVCCINFGSTNGSVLLLGPDGTARTAHR